MGESNSGTQGNSGAEIDMNFRQGEQLTQLAFKNNQVNFDPVILDKTIVSHGIRFVHWIALHSPIGLIDKYDSRRPDVEADTFTSNGRYYIKAGILMGLMSGNTKDARAIEGGIMHSAVAQFTPTRFYECGPNQESQRVYLSVFDKLYLEQEDILVSRDELASFSEDGWDRLDFPAVQVQAVVDANGIRYECCDFQVEKGGIKWVGKRPGINPNTGKGVIYSIRYRYRPHWYVERLLHEMRLVSSEDQLRGRLVIPMNQSCIVNREYVFLNKLKAEEANGPQNAESARAPSDGGFGPK